MNEPEFCCPVCLNTLYKTNSGLQCASCNITYPVLNNIPVLINEQNSVFRISEITGPDNADNKPSANAKTQKAGFKESFIKALMAIQRAAPDLSLNLTAKKNYRLFSDLLFKGNDKPVVLVIGGRSLGKGMEEIIKLPITFIATDIAPGEYTKVICDAHNLPFKDETFDGVIMQAVVEYLVDPYQAVNEVYRVLKKDGLVYAETPFMQQVHGGAYDFMRFTMLGHRRLFRRFGEIAAGTGGGTGSSLAWSVKYFILSFSDKKIVREFLLIIGNWLGFIFKYFDHLTIHKMATLDGANGFYFMGKKSEKTLADRDLIKQYKGMI